VPKNLKGQISGQEAVRTVSIRSHRSRPYPRPCPRRGPGPFQGLAKVSAAELDAFGAQVWKTVNEVNLVENIRPTRAWATLVLHKGADHSVTRVRVFVFFLPDLGHDRARHPDVVQYGSEIVMKLTTCRVR
jgi:hypothetical protein